MVSENSAAVGREAFDSGWIVRDRMAGMVIDDNSIDEHLIKIVCGGTPMPGVFTTRTALFALIGKATTPETFCQDVRMGYGIIQVVLAQFPHQNSRNAGSNPG